MSKEAAYLLFVQIVVSINTVLFAFGIAMAKKGRIDLHKKINGIAVATTLVGVVGLVVTLLMGWHYQDLTSPTRLLIHRGFAVPLLPLLILVAYAGITNKVKLHKALVAPTLFFWTGVLITGWWFF